MPTWNGKYENPFYHPVKGSVKSELSARASHYGKQVRGGVNQKAIEWSYGKTAYGHVTGKGAPALGFPGPKTMSDSQGNLTLYKSNLIPKLPLLMSMDVTNDGTIGSLLRGNFSFTYWPTISAGGFSMNGIDTAFFTPGKEVKMSWGWSYGGPACKQAFSGIISNFNWSFTADLSIAATVSIVSAATIAVGASGDQSTKSEEGEAAATADPLAVVFEGNNLASIIDADLGTGQEEGEEAANGQPPPPPPPPEGGAGVPDWAPELPGDIKYLAAGQTVSKYMDYVGIGWPYQESDGEEEEVEPKDPPPPPPESAAVKPFWYINVYSLVDFANKIIKKFEGQGGGVLGKVFTVEVEGNVTQKLPIQSAFPIDVIFPDPQVMGAYGECKPAYTDQFVVGGNEINIGSILVGTDYIKKTFKDFIQEKSADVFYKNLTSWFETLLKRINVASGEMYQLTPTLCEPPSNFDGNSDGALPKSILSIEDANLSKAQTDSVIPLKFTADIYRPLIKSVSISSKPPAPMAAAAYVQARGKGEGANIETKTGKGNGEGVAEIKQKLTEAVANFTKTGFNDSWCEAFRGNLSKLKKLEPDVNNAHWLNKALYPVDFSVTIDGVSGFRFGDVLSTNLVPASYLANGLVFVITKIEHKISGGMWETTLHTAARISMK